MSKRVSVKPGKGESTIGFFMGLIFCFIGLFFIIKIPMIAPFGVLWILIAAAGTITNGINAFSNKGITSHEIILDNHYQEDVNNIINNEKPSEERLKELQNLYETGLITDTEYQDKRKQIIEDI